MFHKDAAMTARVLREVALTSLCCVVISAAQECSPQAEIFKLVIGSDEGSYIRLGQPAVTSLATLRCTGLLPRSCRRWDGQPSCCQNGFFERVEEDLASEAARFQVVRDAYQHLDIDVLKPATNAVASHVDGALETKITDLSKDLTIASKLVLTYIDSCEDPIRLHLAATTCELCDPQLHRSLTEERYLEVSSDSCKVLWQDCQDAPAMLEKASQHFEKAATAVLSIIEAGFQDKDLARAELWLSRATKQLKKGSTRTGFYLNKDKFCENIGDAGFGYRPLEWGDVSQLHPSAAVDAIADSTDESQVKPTNEETTDLPGATTPSTLTASSEKLVLPPEAEKDLERLAASDEVNAVLSSPKFWVHPAKSVRSMEAEALRGKCAHGRPVGKHCFCDACWGGPSCSISLKPGPMFGQPFEPILAQETLGSKQTLAVIGCKLPIDLNRQLARIKLVPVDAEKVHVAGYEPCKTKSTEDSLQRLKEHIPVLATERRLEYYLDMQQGSEGLYAVCWCFGVECHHAPDESWSKLGEVNVLRTRAELAAAVHAVDFDPPEVKYEPQNEAFCSDQNEWMTYPMNSVTFTAVGQAVVFECQKGFTNLVGVKSLQCFKGEWRVHTSSDQEKTTASISDLPSWNKELPHCRWGINICSKPPTEFQDVLLSYPTDEGLARYLCKNPEQRLAIKGSVGPLKVGQLVLVDGTTISKIAKVDSSTDKYEVQDLSSSKSTLLSLEKFEVLPVDGTFSLKCQQDGSFSPHSFHARCASIAPVVEEASVSIVKPSKKDDSDEKTTVLVTMTKGEAEALKSSKEITITSDTGVKTKVTTEKVAASMLELSQTTVHHMRLNLSAGREAFIRRWPVHYVKEPVGKFNIDRCWTSLYDCSDGEVAEDTAAAIGIRANKQAFEELSRWNTIYFTAVIMAFAVIALGLGIGWFVWKNKRKGEGCIKY